MLVTDKYDLSLSLKCEEPVKYTFKEILLGQDHPFKKQVLNDTYSVHIMFDI